MHHYLIDERVSKQGHEAALGKVVSWIKTSRIAGEQYLLKSPQQVIEQTKKLASTTGNKPTIVVVGDDLSLDLAISALSDDQRKTALGFIPLTPTSQSARLLGSSDWRQACNALVRAKRSSFKLIKIEDYSVLTHCALPARELTDNTTPHETKLRINDQLDVSLPATEITITNLNHETHLHQADDPFLIEASSTREIQQRIQNKKPLIALPQGLKSEPKHTILRLKAQQAQVKTTRPLLLHGLIQLRTDFEIKPLKLQQQFIVDRKRDPLT